jgi:hypothetical protein
VLRDAWLTATDGMHVYVSCPDRVRIECIYLSPVPGLYWVTASNCHRDLDCIELVRLSVTRTWFVLSECVSLWMTKLPVNV